MKAVAVRNTNQKSRRLDRRTYALLALAAGITLAVSACGPATPGAPNSAAAKPGVNGIPASASASLPASTSNATINTISGTYSGRLNRMMPDGSTQSQPFTLSVTQTDPNPNQNGAKFSGSFSSSGPAGNFAFTTGLGIQLNGFVSGQDSEYAFSGYSETSPAVPSDLSESYVALQLIVALNSSTQFDPTQSRIYFLDCGFSQGTNCQTTSNDVWFDSVLGKR